MGTFFEFILRVILLPFFVILWIITLIDNLVEIISDFSEPLGLDTYVATDYYELDYDWESFFYIVGFPLLLAWTVLKLLYSILFVILMPIRALFNGNFNISGNTLLSVLKVIGVIAIIVTVVGVSVKYYNDVQKEERYRVEQEQANKIARDKRARVQNNWYNRYSNGTKVSYVAGTTKITGAKKGFTGEIVGANYSGNGGGKIKVYIKDIDCIFFLHKSCSSSSECTNYKCLSWDGYDENGRPNCYAEGDTLSMPSWCVSIK